LDPLSELKLSLAEAVSSSLERSGASVPPGTFEITDRTQKTFGDLSASVVIRTASSMGRSPVTMAKEVAASMPDLEMIQKVEAVKGYLNFSIDWPAFGSRIVERILRERENFGRPERPRGTLLLEHTSVNPTGPLNIARSRNSIIGEALSGIHEYLGWKVRRHYLLNDIGHQVVVIYWGREKGLVSEDLRERYSKYASKDDFRTLFTYVEAMAAADDPKAREEISDLDSRTHTDASVLDGVRSLSRRCLDGQLESLSRLGIEFDEITPESQFIEGGCLQDILARLKKEGSLVKNEDGSVGLDLSAHGLTRRKSESVTLLKADGSSTYTLRDLAYHEWKFRDGDLFITVLGEDHKREFRELDTTLKMLGHEKDLRAAFYSFVTYEGGKKMSTREGRTVPLDEMMDEAVERSREEVKSRRGELPPEKIESIASQVGLGAIKFNILKVDTDKSISFRWDEAIDFAGDSSAYVQYACARASSILRKSGQEKGGDLATATNPEEQNLIWSMARTPAVLARAGADMKPNYVAEHAIEVASLFNRFYMKHRVIQAEEPVRSARLALVACVREILSLMLHALGIAAPEEI
jgi:arginyl-tRNA synthetase